MCPHVSTRRHYSFNNQNSSIHIQEVCQVLDTHVLDKNLTFGEHTLLMNNFLVSIN